MSFISGWIRPSKRPSKTNNRWRRHLAALEGAIPLREVDAKRAHRSRAAGNHHTQVKQRREAMAEYDKASRPELAKQEEELSVLLSLPPQ
jgi:uncharacterized protein YqeY